MHPYILQMRRVGAVLILLCAAASAQEETATLLASAQPVVLEKSGSEAEARAPRSLRARLEERGVVYSITLRGEAMGAMSGGLAGGRPMEPMGSIEASMTFDLAKMLGGRGQIVASAQSLHGVDADAELIGARQKISNLNENPFTKITELYYADEAGRWRWKLGRMYADPEFGSAAHAAAFLNAGFGVLANAPMPTYPAPSPSAFAAYKATEWMSLAAGVWRGGRIDAPDGSRARQGVYATGEAQFAPKLWAEASYRIGLWRQSDSLFAEGATAGSRARAAHGVYLVMEQQLRRNGSTHLFFRVSQGRGGGASGFWNGGVERQGVSRRKEDSLGLGFARLRAVGADKSETVTELYYKLHLRGRMWAQPDVQQVRSVGGARRRAWAGGVRLIMEL